MPIRFKAFAHSIRSLYLLKPVLITGTIATSLTLGLRQIGLLQPLELATLDQMVRLHHNGMPDPRLLIVAITEEDVARYKLPLSDQIVAQALAKLQIHQPRAIGLGIFRDLPQEPGHQALQKQLKAANVIPITKLGSGDDPRVPGPEGVPQEQIGFVDVVTDPDGVVRRNLLFAEAEGKNFLAFSFQLAYSYLLSQKLEPQINETTPDLLTWGKAHIHALGRKSGGYQTLDDRGFQTLLRYRTGEKVAPEISLSELLMSPVPPQLVKDKIVLIGTTARSSRDFFFTPYSATALETPTIPGIYLHAQMVSQLLDGVLGHRSPFWFWPEWAEWLWVGGWTVSGAALAWGIRHPLRLGVLSLTTIAALFLACFGLFALEGWIPWAAPALGFTLAIGGIVAYRPLHDALHDSLTGLPNWTAFMKRLNRAIEYTRHGQNYLFAVLFLDVDRFKFINERLGYRLGDQLLVEIAQRLRQELRSRDVLARSGGDEFTLLLEGVKNITQVQEIAAGLQTSLAAPFQLQGQEVYITASMGLVWGTSGYVWAEDLIRDAHTAMYHAKFLGKARYEVFNTSMRVQVVTFVELEADLRRAIALSETGGIETQEFRLYYQPIVLLETGRIVGFEALLRWEHPQKGIVSPAKFLPIAEETGLIVNLSQWILKTACQQLKTWQQQLGEMGQAPELFISVNLSAQDFSRLQLVDQITQVLQQLELNPSHLKLEITETMVMRDTEATLALLRDLKTLKIRLCIDDFGTGYSSLSYLQRFPFDSLKVDQFFVRRLGEQGENLEMVQMIVKLAHDLGMEVIAEGVEQPYQREQLRSLHCKYGQGFLFAKPLTRDEAGAMLLAEWSNEAIF
ncbi:MAG: EAL domain-containing protein [Leptolyngbyaceae cyanobacterium bins.59]|nr:EAL domain-containing protein [Leptolyngbyaceae cyanobacterium bins.59]